MSEAYIATVNLDPMVTGPVWRTHEVAELHYGIVSYRIDVVPFSDQSEWYWTLRRIQDDTSVLIAADDSCHSEAAAKARAIEALRKWRESHDR
jgi:hypothetical protein